MWPVQTKISQNFCDVMIIICTVNYSFSTYFEILHKNDEIQINGLVQIER
jgi:hypothetical protein